MAFQNNLEINGNLQTNPLAELLTETSQANLTGSFRLAHEAQKIVVYIKGGMVVFAASNAREHRLFEILLRNNQIAKDHLQEVPNFTNDFELAETLKTRGLFSTAEMDAIFCDQIEIILKTVFGWETGEWTFSPLARIKENIQFNVGSEKLLLEYARNLPHETIVRRFKSVNETFGANRSAALNQNLLPTEAFVLSRFEKSFLKVQEVQSISGLPAATTLQILYSLWLVSLLYRQNWNPAFSEKTISKITSAKLSLKKEDPVSAALPANLSAAETILKSPAQDDAAIRQQATTSPEVTIEEYLRRTENAASYYELFDVAANASAAEIKNAYFEIARQFHPDKYHQEKDAVLLQRIQNAFTQTARAYETLKGEDTRKTYDYKLNKELTALKSNEKSGAATTVANGKSEQADSAKEFFEQGFSLLMEEEYDQALPFLGRAVQLTPANAQYHAYYGKALSNDQSKRHRADVELQAAVRLDPKNATFRIMLAEFYIQIELLRRAEGELQRLLLLFPSNKEARALLDSLPKK